MAINEQYIDNIAQEQLLSDEEERQLADRIKVGDARALEQLTKANLRFVVSLAHHYRGHGLDEDDLVSEGNIALMHAAAQFDGSRGLRFVVFAAPFIRQAMERAIEEQNVLEDTSRKATRRGERTAPRPLSLDHSIIEDANAIPIDGGLDRGVVREQLLEGLACLDDRERRVILLLYGLDGEACTMAVAGERMGLKRERVRQIRDKALRKLSRRIKR